MMSSHNKALLSSAAVWGLMAALILLMLTACTTGSSGLGEQAGTTSLPTGLRMLTASNAECAEETAYVRFTRSQDGEELLLECYG